MRKVMPISHVNPRKINSHSKLGPLTDRRDATIARSPSDIGRLTRKYAMPKARPIDRPPDDSQQRQKLKDALGQTCLAQPQFWQSDQPRPLTKLTVRISTTFFQSRRRTSKSRKPMHSPKWCTASVQSFIMRARFGLACTSA